MPLTGCASRQAAVLGAAKSLFSPNQAIDQMPLRQDLRYLRVTVAGSKAVLMVLGYVDKDERGRPIEVWYSADGEVLRTQAGRLVGLVGTPIEWHRVSLSAEVPEWRHIGHEARYQRRLDEMPLYRWGRQDGLTIRPSTAPTRSGLMGGAQQAQWFEEQVDGKRLPPARYALAPGGDTPIYGEQCLGADFCLSWQTWPPPRASKSE